MLFVVYLTRFAEPLGLENYVLVLSRAGDATRPSVFGLVLDVLADDWP